MILISMRQNPRRSCDRTLIADFLVTNRVKLQPRSLLLSELHFQSWICFRILKLHRFRRKKDFRSLQVYRHYLESKGATFSCQAKARRKVWGCRSYLYLRPWQNHHKSKQAKAHRKYHMTYIIWSQYHIERFFYRTYPVIVCLLCRGCILRENVLCICQHHIGNMICSMFFQTVNPTITNAIAELLFLPVQNMQRLLGLLHRIPRRY